MSPVSDADRAVEELLRSTLYRARRRDAVLGEEFGATGSGARQWVIDPIDGTKNFVRGVPVWATLIALVEHGHPVVGVVSAPALRRRWWAAVGAGAYTRDAQAIVRPIKVSGVCDLADAYVSTTHLGTWAEHRSRQSYLALVDATWENRAFGDFWQHCLVAEGAIDLAAEPIVSPWDLAAVQVLVEQAGGRFTDLDGVPRFDGGTALSSNGLLHDAALAVLQR
jgi:histidinol-phosphatase